MRIRALIVDDEPHARSRIRKLILDREDCLIVGECKNGSEAVDEINSKEPDLVFLDIQMPDMTGFEVIQKIKKEKLPYIIFTTAYDNYAIKAFDIHANDYLLKPFDVSRFNDSIERIKKHLTLKETVTFKKNIQDLLKAQERSEKENYFSIELNYKGRNIQVDFEEIHFFEASGNYVKIHLEDKGHLFRCSMSETEEMLSNLPILRIHRSYILNTTYVDSVRYLSNNEYSFIMKNGKRLKSGRSYKENITSFLKEFNI